MKRIELLLDPANPTHGQLEASLRENLTALETIRFKTITKPAEAGTLAVEGQQVVAFVIEHYDKLIPLVTAILTLASQLIAQAPKPTSKKDRERTKQTKSLMIVIDSEKLSVPASKGSQRRFLKRLESVSQGESPEKEPQRATARPRKKKPK